MVWHVRIKRDLEIKISLILQWNVLNFNGIYIWFIAVFYYIFMRSSNVYNRN